MRLSRCLPLPVLLAIVLLLPACASVNMQDLQGLMGIEAPLDEPTVASGLKEALRIGTERASGTLSVDGGFGKNDLLRLALPEDLQKVGSRLRTLGLGDQVDALENQMNSAAERAAGEAVDVFASAIRSMTVQDAFSILDGPDNAATLYFQGRIEAELTSRFQPVVASVMEEMGVYRTYSSLIDRYNAIPLISSVDVDLESYIVSRTLSGLFSTLAGEELKIRQDPVARTTDLLKRVFGRNDIP